MNTDPAADADGPGVVLLGVYNSPDVFLNFSRKSSQRAVCGRAQFDTAGQAVKVPVQPLSIFSQGMFGPGSAKVLARGDQVRAITLFIAVFPDGPPP